MAKNESSSCWLNALGVPGLCIASHQHEHWFMVKQPGHCVAGTSAVKLGFVQTGCPVINPLGRVSPGGTTHSAAMDQGFRGILVSSFRHSKLVAYHWNQRVLTFVCLNCCFLAHFSHQVLLSGRWSIWILHLRP